MARPAGEAFHMDFTLGRDRVNHVTSNWDADMGWLSASFRNANVRFENTGMTLSSVREQTPLAPYTSAEFQRAGIFGFGRYEVVMRASSENGAVASFFTHVGGAGNPHDEIDFELLGITPRRVHINYFRNGANNPADVDLWFDASEADHLYAFEWSASAITWYVDGVKVREVTMSDSPIGIPITPGRAMASVWAANKQASEWAGKPDYERASATYRCMSHVPAGQKAQQCSDTFKPPPRAP